MKLLIIIAFIILSGCKPIETIVNYNDNFSEGSAVSKPIYLSIRDTKKDRLYLLLSHDLNSEDFNLHVRWVSYSKRKQFNGYESNLHFLVNGLEIIELLPSRAPRVVSYHLEPQAVEEETIYKLNKEQLHNLASAKSVVMTVRGKFKNRVTHFNKSYTFRGFQNFDKNS